MSEALKARRRYRPAAEEWVEGSARARRGTAELVVDRRAEGASFHEVAAASRYSRKRVHQIVRAARAQPAAK